MTPKLTPKISEIIPMKKQERIKKIVFKWFLFTYTRRKNETDRFKGVKFINHSEFPYKIPKIPERWKIQIIRIQIKLLEIESLDKFNFYLLVQ